MYIKPECLDEYLSSDSDDSRKNDREDLTFKYSYERDLDDDDVGRLDPYGQPFGKYYWIWIKLYIRFTKSI